MELLARASERTDWKIQVSDFEGWFNPVEYCDWIASLGVVLEREIFCEERKFKFVATKLKGHALV